MDLVGLATAASVSPVFRSTHDSALSASMSNQRSLPAAMLENRTAIACSGR